MPSHVCMHISGDHFAQFIHLNVSNLLSGRHNTTTTTAKESNDMQSGAALWSSVAMADVAEVVVVVVATRRPIGAHKIKVNEYLSCFGLRPKRIHS